MKQLLLTFLCFGLFATNYAQTNTQKETLLLFFRPDCVYCQALLNDWNKNVHFQQTVSEKYKVSYIDITTPEGKLQAQKHSVKSVPLLVKNPNELEGKSQLKGYRSLDKIASFLNIELNIFPAFTARNGQFICGNGIIEEGEQCDDANNSNTDTCLNSCILATCGDGYIQNGIEACDDNNTNDNDGCQSDCTLSPTCGNGIIEEGEQCDDANDSNTDACLNSCVLATCGDGYVQNGIEACDDSNTNDNDGCESDCTLSPSCGNGIVEEGEECDGGPGCNNCILTPEGTFYIEQSYGIKYITNVDGALKTANRSIKLDPTTNEAWIVTNHQFSSQLYSYGGSAVINESGVVSNQTYINSPASANLNKNFPLPIAGSNFVGNLLGEGSNPKGITLRSITNPSVLNKQIVPADIGENDFDIFAATTQADGKLLLAGRCVFSQGRMIIIRLNTDYSFDTSFNSVGYIKLAFGSDCQARAIGVQSSGKIIVAGHRIAPGSVGIVLRLTTNGTLDTTFGNNGSKLFNYEVNTQNGSFTLNAISEVYSLYIAQSDNIYLCGTGSSSGLWNGKSIPAFHGLTSQGNDWLIMRDLTHTTATSLLNVDGSAYKITATPTEMVYLGGFSTEINQKGLYLQRYDSVGNIDTNFSFKNGTTHGFYDLSIGDDIIHDIALQNDGKIMLVGESNNSGFYTRLINNTLQTSAFETQPTAVTLWPNPVNNQITIQFTIPTNETIRVSIYDLVGKEVYINSSLQLESNSSITISQLEALLQGLYMIKIENGTLSHTLKFIKQ